MNLCNNFDISKQDYVFKDLYIESLCPIYGK